AAQWVATAEEISGRIALLPLALKSFQASGVEGRGVVFRLRRRRDRFPDLPFPPELAPPIPGLENPLEPPPPPPPPGPRRRWSVSLRGAELADVREVWVDRYRLRGEAAASGGFELRLKRSARIRPSRLEVSEGRIEVGEEPAVSGLRGRLELSSERFDHSEHRGLQAVPFLTMSLSARGRAAGLGFLAASLRRWPWLRIEGGSGPLATELRLAGGRLAPGSRAHFEPRDLTVGFLDYEAAGRGRIELEAGDEELRVRTRFSDYHVLRSGQGAPHIRGNGLLVELRNPEASFPPSFDRARLAVRMPRAEIPDLSYYNAYLPSAAGLEIRSGRGTVEARFDADLERGSGEGGLDLEADGVGIAYRGIELRGDLSIESRFPRARLAERSFRLDGTRLAVTDGAVAGRPGDEPWTARISVPRGVLEPGRPTFLTAEVTGTLSDAVPVVAFFAERHPLPAWVLGALDLGELTMKAEVESGRERLAVRGLEAEADPLRLAGAVEIAGPADRTGRLLLTYRGLAIGFELRGDSSDLKLLRARKWFEDAAEVPAVRRRGSRAPP
ncbi:MAG TPA: hypothetical protein VM599_07360, partial [Thermoanaerobaculia bacterium]|nr:hypothetical protein [Thermoanaerobaculia bacterium]